MQVKAAADGEPAVAFLYKWLARLKKKINKIKANHDEIYWTAYLKIYELIDLLEYQYYQEWHIKKRLV